MEAKIILDKKVNLKNCTLIEGFPGVGLVGTIAAGYLVQQRKMELIGHIYSKGFPPMVSIHKGRPYFPVRIYKDPKSNFCILLAEFVIPGQIVHSIADEILVFAKKAGIKKIVSLAGMTSANPGKKQIYGIVSNNEMENYLKLKKVNLINEGVTTGVSGVLMAQCAVKDFPAMSLLIESNPGEPDPRATIELIEKLDNLIGLKIDTKDLIKEASQIEKNMGKMMQKIGSQKNGTNNGEDVPMYQ